MGKLDRAVGFVCIALGAFAAISALASLRNLSSGPGWAAGLASTPGLVSVILALVAAIPGFFLVFRKGAI